MRDGRREPRDMIGCGVWVGVAVAMRVEVSGWGVMGGCGGGGPWEVGNGVVGGGRNGDVVVVVWWAELGGGEMPKGAPTT